MDRSIYLLGCYLNIWALRYSSGSARRPCNSYISSFNPVPHCHLHHLNYLPERDEG